jgi:integrase
MGRAKRRPTGFIRIVQLAGGEAFYAQMRTADGRRLQRRLGFVWAKRSRPPAGHLTQAQAEARLQAMLNGEDESVAVELPPGASPTFAAAGREWLAYVEHDRKRRRSTVQDYRRELERVLIPEFGELIPLDQIDTARIDSYREKLVAEGRLSARTINKRLAQLHAIFKRAQRVHGLSTNPVSGAERQPHRRSGDFMALEAQGVELLATNAANEQDAALFEVAAFTGLRLGELRGLRWADVDWLRRLVHVRRSFTRGEEGPPKSGKVRSVPLVDQAARALDRLSRRKRFTEDDDLVFVNALGKPFEESAMRRRFYAALDAAELPRIRFHDLRHTFGTLAVQAFPLTDVKAYMGHADIQTTMIYVHHVPQHDAADKLSRLLAASMSDEVGCAPGARSQSEGDAEDAETAHSQAESHAGGGTRTPDTRIMIPLL